MAPSQDSSHHQDYYMFSGGSQPKPSFPTVTGRGPHPIHRISSQVPLIWELVHCLGLAGHSLFAFTLVHTEANRMAVACTDPQITYIRPSMRIQVETHTFSYFIWSMLKVLQSPSVCSNRQVGRIQKWRDSVNANLRSLQKRSALAFLGLPPDSMLGQAKRKNVGPR